jgi:Fe-S-cluster containining protein
VTRIPLPMAPSAPGAPIPCTACGKCCTYVSVGINAPTSVKNASDIVWYLYHDQVSVYRDGDGEWSVVFETRCRYLEGSLLCGVYEARPVICRDFDNTTCEVNSPEGGRTYASPEEFLDWLREIRPGIYRRLSPRYLPAALRRRARRTPLAAAAARAVDGAVS